MKFWIVSGVLIAIVSLILLNRPAQLITTAPQVVTAAEVQPTGSQLPPPASASVPQRAMTETPTLSSEIRSAITQVAAAYEQTSQYPPYSIPLDEQQTELLNPDAGAVSHRDLKPLGLPGELTVSLSAYRYQTDERIDALVVLRGSDALFTQVSKISLSLRDGKNQLLQPLTANASLEAGQWSYSTSLIADANWPNELNLTAEVQLTDGQTMKQSAPFQIFHSVAEITGLAAHRIEDNELVIPVNIKNAEPGYYKLAASLHYADKKPLAYLQGKGRMQKNGTIELHVHGSLLQPLPTAQNLWLGNFQLRKIPEKPGPAVGWGTSRKAFYVVKDINPADYSAAPFQDVQTTMRLHFLQSLGQPDTGRSGT